MANQTDSFGPVGADVGTIGADSGETLAAILAVGNTTGANDIVVADAQQVHWGDVGLARQIAGIIKVTDGAAGSGSLQAATIISGDFRDETQTKFSLSDDVHFRFYNAFDMKWSSTALFGGAPDVGLARDSAGFLKVTDGSTGFASLILANTATAIRGIGSPGGLWGIVLNTTASGDGFAFTDGTSTEFSFNASGLMVNPAGGYSFWLDADTAFYRTGADAVAIKTGGTDAIQVDASQNVSIPNGTVTVPLGSPGAPSIVSMNATTGIYWTNSGLDWNVATNGVRRLVVTNVVVEHDVALFATFNGAAATPARAWSNDPDTGVFLIDIGRYGIATAGVLAVEADASQNVIVPNGQLKFGSGDVGFVRTGVGVVKVTDGSTGFGQLQGQKAIWGGTGSNGEWEIQDSSAVVKIGANSANGWFVASTMKLKWSQSGDAIDTLDIGLERSAAGVLKVNNGSSGFGTLSVDGIVGPSDGTGLVLGGVPSGASTGSTLQLLSVTTTQRGNLVAANGMLVYNTTDAKLQGREAGAWVDFRTGPDPHGALFVSSASATAITAGTFVKIAGTTTAGELQDFTHTTGRLTYAATPTRIFRVEVTVSTTSDTNNIVITLRLAKNGTTVAASEQDRKIGTGADIGNMTASWLVSLANTDFVEPFADIDTGSANITATHLVLSVTPAD